jgi:hypothetical protein
MFPFRQKRQPPVEEKPPIVAEELLLGDNHRVWTLNGYTVDVRLTSLYGEIATSLTTLFKNGKLDAGNGAMFDPTIDTAMHLALSNLESQRDVRPESVLGMLAWRERDVTELRGKFEFHQKRIADAETELKKVKRRWEASNEKSPQNNNEEATYALYK